MPNNGIFPTKVHTSYRILYSIVVIFGWWVDKNVE